MKHLYEITIWGYQGQEPDLYSCVQRLALADNLPSEVFDMREELHYGFTGLLDAVQQSFWIIAGSEEEARQIAKAHCHWYTSGEPKLVDLPA